MNQTLQVRMMTVVEKTEAADCYEHSKTTSDQTPSGAEGHWAGRSPPGNYSHCCSYHHGRIIHGRGGMHRHVAGHRCWKTRNRDGETSRIQGSW